MTRHAPGDLQVSLETLQGYLSQGRCSLALGQAGDWIARAAQDARRARPALTAEAQRWLQSIGEEPTELAPVRAPSSAIPAALMGAPRPHIRHGWHCEPLRCLCGAGNQIGELERARWGVLLLVSLPDWPRETIETMGRRLAGWPDDGSRPVILATAQPCLCGRLGARSCACDEHATRRSMIRLGQFCELLGIADSVVVMQ